MLILVVDDEPDILDAIELMWAGQGVDVETAPSAEAALANLTSAPDVVLTDFKMPGMDGIQFVRQLHERFPDVPAVLMTAFADPQIKDRAQSAGIVDFITKPFDPDDLLRRVTAAA